MIFLLFSATTTKAYMLLTSSTDLLNSETAENSSTKELYSIETYAESLMNEIFADIDTILNVQDEHNCHHIKEKYLDNSHTQLAKTETSLSPKVQRSLMSASLVKSSLKTDLVVNSSFPGAITTTQRSQTSGLDKFIYMGFGWLLATLSTLWLTNFALFNRENTQLNSSLQNSQTPASVYMKSDPQLDLVNYMLSAFSIIEQQEKSNYTTIVKPRFRNNGLPVPTTQPQITQGQIKASPVIVAKTLPAVTQDVIATNATNRKYISVKQSPVLRYQPQIKASPSAIADKNLPPVPLAALTTGVTNRKNIPIEQLPDSVYQQPTVSSTRIPQPSPTVVNSPPIKNIQPATQPKTKKTEIYSQPLKEVPPKTLPEKQLANTATYSVQLEGILESNDKSVALFNIDGITRGINVGENIGSTGWIL
ncbi:MAG: hypothetical protein ACKN9K_23535, partial [Dolichospermum sp.]